MSDYMIRATAANGQIRAFAATTRDLTEYARNAHNTSPVVTAALGRTMTAAVMMGSMLKGDKELLTVKIQGDGPIGSITVTADSHCHVKGYAQNPMVLIPANSIGKLDVAGAIGKGVLSVIKDIGLKDPYVGQTDLVSGEIAEDLTYYFAVSEQTPSSVGLGVLMNKDNTSGRRIYYSAYARCIRRNHFCTRKAFGKSIFSNGNARQWKNTGRYFAGASWRYGTCCS